MEEFVLTNKGLFTGQVVVSLPAKVTLMDRMGLSVKATVCHYWHNDKPLTGMLRVNRP